MLLEETNSLRLDEAITILIKNCHMLAAEEQGLNSATEHLDALLMSVSIGDFSSQQVKLIINLVFTLAKKILTTNTFSDIKRYNNAMEYYELARQLAEQHQLTEEVTKLGIQIADLQEKSLGLNENSMQISGSSSGEDTSGGLIKALLNYFDVIERSNDSKMKDTAIAGICKVEAKFLHSVSESIMSGILSRALGKKEFDKFERVFTIVHSGIGAKLFAVGAFYEAWQLYSSIQSILNQYKIYSKHTKYSDEVCLKVLSLISRNQHQSEAKNTYVYTNAVFDWRRYQQVLFSARELFSQPTDNFLSLSKKYTAKIKELISTMVSDCENILGPAPCKYAICGLGSMSNNTMLTHSDVEYALLINFEVECTRELEKRAATKYFSAFVKLINFKVLTIGESRRGFRIDSEGSPENEDRLIGSPEKLVRSCLPPLANSYNDPLSFSLMHCCFVCGETALFNEYIAQVEKMLNVVTQHNNASKNVSPSYYFAIEFAKYHLQEYLNFPAVLPNSFDLKKDVTSFLGYLAMDLALYYKLNAYNIDSAITKLVLHKYISDDDKKIFLRALEILFRIRNRVQLTNNHQQDEIVVIDDDGSKHVKLSDDEIGLIEVVQKGVLLPWFYRLRVLLYKNKWDNNAHRLMFSKLSFSLNSGHEIGNKTIYKDLDSLACSLAIKQSDAHDFCDYANSIPELLRSRFIGYVLTAEKKVNGDEERGRSIIAAMRYLPRLDGGREQVGINAAKWHHSLQQMLVASGQDKAIGNVVVAVTGPYIGKGYLRQEIAETLISVEGRIKLNKNNPWATYNHKGEIFAFSADTTSFGSDYAAQVFGQYFFGIDIVRTELCAFSVRINDQQLEYPVVIFNMPSNLEPLSNYLVVHDGKSPCLDQAEFSRLILFQLLIAPTLPLKNIFLQKKAFSDTLNEPLYRLININSKAFQAAFREFADLNADECKLNILNFVFCLEEMNKTLDKRVVKEFLLLDFVRVLENWLIDVKEYYTSCHNCFGSKLTEKEYLSLWINDEFSDLFASGMIKRLTRKVNQMRMLLWVNDETPPKKLILSLASKWGHLYTGVLDMELSPLKRLHMLASLGYKFEPVVYAHDMWTQHDFLPFTPFLISKSNDLICLQEVINELHQQSNAYKSLQHYSDSYSSDIVFKQWFLQQGSEAIEMMINSLDITGKYHDITGLSKEQLVLEVLSLHGVDLNFNNLRILHWNLFTDDMLKKIIKSFENTLNKLSLVDTGLTAASMRYIVESCNSLQYLQLSEHDWRQINMGFRKNVQSKQQLSFLGLTHLVITRYSELTELNLELPELEYLVINYCPNLIKVRCTSSVLKYVNLDKCPGISDSSLRSTVSNSIYRVKKIVCDKNSSVAHKVIRQRFAALACDEFVDDRLIRLLNCCEQFRHISLSDCDLGNGALLTLTRMLKEQDGLFSVDLSKNTRLDAKIIKSFIHELKHHSLLRELNLSAIFCIEQLIDVLIDLVEHNYYLDKLILNACNLNFNHIRRLVVVLLKRNIPISLYFANNDLGDAGASVISTLLQKRLVLSLDLSCTGIFGPGLDAIVSALTNSGCINLNLSGNGVEDNSLYMKFYPVMDKAHSLISVIGVMPINGAPSKRRSKGRSGRFTASLRRNVPSTYKIQLDGDNSCAIKRYLERNQAELANLIDAVRANDIAMATRLLKLGVSPLACHDEGASALHLAVESGNVTLIKLMISLSPINGCMLDSAGQRIIDVAPNEEIEHLLLNAHLQGVGAANALASKSTFFRIKHSSALCKHDAIERQSGNLVYK